MKRHEKNALWIRARFLVQIIDCRCRLLKSYVLFFDPADKLGDFLLIFLVELAETCTQWGILAVLKISEKLSGRQVKIDHDIEKLSDRGQRYAAGDGTNIGA